MVTPQVEILRELQYQNMLCCAPPTDDDDAYAIAIARREDSRSKRRYSHLTMWSSYDNSSHINNSEGRLENIGGAFIVSNDFFRDAMTRDRKKNGGNELKIWLNGGRQNNGSSSLCSNNDVPPGRISFSFCNLGSMNEYGDARLDFLPNPRHALIEFIEKENNKSEML